MKNLKTDFKYLLLITACVIGLLHQCNGQKTKFDGFYLSQEILLVSLVTMDYVYYLNMPDGAEELNPVINWLSDPITIGVVTYFCLLDFILFNRFIVYEWSKPVAYSTIILANILYGYVNYKNISIGIKLSL